MAANRFVSQAGELEVSQCFYCKHKYEKSQGCKAFPDIIPDDILYNRKDHTKPYPGDHGVRFKLAEELFS